MKSTTPMTLRQIRTLVRTYAAITLAVTILMVITVTALPLEILLVIAGIPVQSRLGATDGWLSARIKEDEAGNRR